MLRKLLIGVGTATALFAAGVSFSQTGSPDLRIASNGKISIKAVAVDNVNGNIITITTKWGSYGLTWAVYTDGETKFLRRRGNASALADLKSGHIINIDGRLVTTALNATISAGTIKNLSDNKTSSSLSGIIAGADGPNRRFTIKSRGEDVTVTASNATQINKSGVSIVFSELRVGNKVAVKGLWDRAITTPFQADLISVETRRQFRNGVVRSGPGATLPTSMTVAFEGFDYNVLLSSATSVKNRRGNSIIPTDIMAGHKITINEGTEDGTTIAPVTLTDLSL